MPHSGWSRQAYLGYLVTRTLSFGRSSSSVSGQVFRQLFVPLFARLATAVLGDDLRVVHRLGQPEGCVGRFRRVAEVQSQLVRILKVAFAPIAKSPLHQFVEGQLVLVAFLRELFDGLIFGLKSDVLLPKLLSLGFKLRAFGLEFRRFGLEFGLFGLEFDVTIGKRLRLLSKQLKQLRFRK